MKRLPWATALLALACLGATWVPGASELLLWGREDIARGEVWRLFSGLAVHLSPSHLGWNLFALGLAGGVLERRDRQGYILTLGLAAVATGPLLLVLEPAMDRFGGASGLAAAAFALLCLESAAAGGGLRVLALVALALAAAKVGAEAWRGAAVFARASATSFVPSVWAHALGVASAALVCAVRRSGLTGPAVSPHSRTRGNRIPAAREDPCTWTVSTP